MNLNANSLMKSVMRRELHIGLNPLLFISIFRYGDYDGLA